LVGHLILQPRLRIAPTPFEFLFARPGAPVAAKKSTTKWPRRDFPRYVRRENAHIRSLRHRKQKPPPTRGQKPPHQTCSEIKGLTGWGGRTRTSEWRNQNPLPYHLATPQRVAHPCAAAARGPKRGGFAERPAPGPEIAPPDDQDTSDHNPPPCSTPDVPIP